MLQRLILKIKRREGIYAYAYCIAVAIRAFSVPSIKCIHLPLYYLDHSVKRLLGWLASAFWYVPLFKARCECVGKRLQLPDGVPYVVGSHLKIVLGDNVTIGRTTIGASKCFDEAVLEIGNHSTIGYGTILSI